jgi:porphobilinogen deaminase
MSITLRLASGEDAVHLEQAARIQIGIDRLNDAVPVIAVPVSAPDPVSDLLEALGAVLRRDDADAAVCPAGLLSAGLPPDVEVAAILRDTDPAYRWISRGKAGPGALPHGTSILTWDDVARAQILYRHPGFEVISAPGWTKVFEGLRQGTWGAACLPLEIVEAGSLWGLDSLRIPEDEIVPAIGQGSVALLVRAGSSDPLLKRLDEPGRANRLRLESVFWWNAMDVPSTVVTARACVAHGRARIEGLVVDADGRWMISDGAEAEERHGVVVARDVAQSCLEAAWRRRNQAARAVPGRVAS